MNKWFEVKNKADGVGEIYIYGVITDEKWFSEDVTPKEFREEMDRLKGVKKINLYINSPGGGVWAGMTIFNMIKRHPAEVVAHVDGMAASIASVIAMAADKIIAPKNSMMMIHNPMTFAMGTADEIRKTADLLDKVKNTIVSTYTDRVKTSEDEIRAMMDSETWMTGEEAVAFGFADEVSEEKKIENCIRDGKAIVNGVEIKIDNFKSFPKDRFTVENKEPEQPKEEPKEEPKPVDYSDYKKKICSKVLTLKEACYEQVAS